MLSDVVVQLIQKWQTEFRETLVDAVDVEKLTQRVRNRQPKAAGASGPGKMSFFNRLTIFCIHFPPRQNRVPCARCGELFAISRRIFYQSVSGTDRK